MQFGVLGPLEVAAGERRLVLSSERQRTILAVLLATRGRAVATDRLVHALWGEAPTANAEKTLRSHVSQLRRDLREFEEGAADAIVTAGGGYQVNLGAHALDAAGFEDLLAEARAVLRDDPGRALGLLDEAVGLWRGRAFGELADHEPVRAEAVRLEQLRAGAAGDRVDAQLALGRYREAIADLGGLLAAAPLDERGHAQLMLALYRSGRQADALAAYRTLQDRLREEVGVDPSPGLQALHEQILRQDADLGGTDAGPRPAGGGASGAVRPEPKARAPGLRVGGLIGRDVEVAQVAALVDANRLVTLTGPGGVGKTRLAEQVAVEVASAFADGVAVCALSAVGDADGVEAALGDALGVAHAGERPAEDVLTDAVGTRGLLLVLDGCEHLLAAVLRIVEAVLGRCPNAAVLATSREPLRLPGERVWQVAPLPVPRRGAGAAEVAEAAAAALFIARAEAAEPTFALDEANAAAVAELCRRLDGLPLAIELAAARIRALEPEDLVARLDQRFSLLGGGPARDTGRHRTLHAVVDWSYALLPTPEARLFDRLSVFAGAFPLAAAEWVCAGPPVAETDVAGLLAELVDKSMVSVERDGGSLRYRLLDTLGDFGAQRLAEAGEADPYRRAHAAYHLARTEALAPQVRGADECAAVTGIEDMIDDLRVAHEWAVADGDSGTALGLPVALYDYLLFRLRAEVFAWTDRALTLPGVQDHPAYPAALATAALGATNRGELAQARRRAEVALDRAAPDSLAALQAVAAHSTPALYEGRFDDVLAVGERLATLASRLGEPYYRALALLDPTLALLYRGDTKAARARAADLEEAAEATGNPTLRAWARYAHGETLLDTEPAEAARRFEAAIDIARAVGSRLPEGVALVSLASLCGRQGEIRRSLSLFRDAVRHWRGLGDETHQLTTLRNLVELLVRADAAPTAALLHGAATPTSPPSFGPEAERLTAAWRTLEQRLGADAAAAAARRARELSLAQAADEALAALDALLEI